MDAPNRDELVAAIIAAPAGAALLARLEASVREDEYWWNSPAEVHADAVSAAIAAVAQLPATELLGDAVAAGEDLVGPWLPGAPANAADALRNAPQRLDICGSVVDRLASLLVAP